jgi:wobble nucleotide-excising tRNase
LWAEYSHNENNSQILPNVMRRILESYFTLLGDIDFDLICNKFDGTRKPICESLFAWLHAGSHNVFDDAFYTVNDDGIALYKDVFKLIFINEGHEAHYNMMMCEPVDNELAE